MSTGRRAEQPTASTGLAPWAAAIAVLAFAVFLPAYAYDYDEHAGFVWDDDDHYLNDRLVNADDGWWRIWLDPQPGVVQSTDAAWVWNYWPLTRSSFWVDRHLFGVWDGGRPNLLASHLVNVGLHALNALLLLVVLRRLGVPGAELAALLFAVHPVTVESVAWITERKNLLSTLFFLLALASWLRFAAGAGARFYAGAGLAFLLALMGKTSTVVLPVVLVIVHWWQRRPWTSRAVVRLAPFFAMSLVAGVTSILFERLFIATGQPSPVSGFAERIAAAGWIAWFYLAKDLLPVGLAFNYPRWTVDPTAVASYLPSAGVLAVAGVLAWQREGWGRPFALALGCFLAALFPVLGFFDLYGMRFAHVADHWQYLACIPVIALIASGVASLPPRFAPLRLGVSLLLLASFGALTWSHAGAFVDDDTLFRHTLERQPDSILANNNVGNRLLAQGRYRESIPYFERAIDAGAAIAAPFVNLGIAKEQVSGDLARGVRYYEMALEVEPDNPQALHYIAMERLARGRVDEAEALLRRALLAHPTYLEGLDLLARVLEQQGRGAEVLAWIERARAPIEDKTSGGRGLVAGVWAAMGAALLGCAGVAWRESRRPGGRAAARAAPAVASRAAARSARRNV